VLSRRTGLALASLAPLALALPAHAGPTLVARSAGTVTAAHSSYSINDSSFVLTGRISFGGRTFSGTASGGASWFCCDGTTEPPVQLHGSSSAGDLDASCIDAVGMYDATPTAGYLLCTGHVGNGPTSTTRLVVVLPIAREDPTQHGYSYSYSGVFAG
jgi:hypothetical protein